MNADFIRIAHRKAVWAELQRILLDRFVAQDGPPKEQLLCEEVPYTHKDVSNEAVLEVLEIIQQHELDEHTEMRQFEFKRKRPKDEQQSVNSQPPRPQGQIEAEGSGPGGTVGEPASAPAGGGSGTAAPSPRKSG